MYSSFIMLYMIIIEEICKICGQPINSYEYWVTTDYNDYFCSENCYQKVYDSDEDSEFIHVSTCPGYSDCEQLNNIRNGCRHEHVITHPESIFDIPNIDIPPRWCSPIELSLVRTTVKLYDFISDSEMKSTKLNEEMLTLTKINVVLAIVMTVFTILNLIIVFVK